MRQTVTGADFRKMIISGAASIEINKQPINELNVFPVPDGDTGTNMSMTIGSAVADLKKTEIRAWGRRRRWPHPLCCGAPEATPA